MENVVDKKDKELKRKQKGKLIKRGVLIVLNALLGCYLVYSISDAVVEFYRKTTTLSEDIITINGLSEEASIEKYKQILDYDDNTNSFSVTSAIDYVYYGGYLNFRNSTETLNENGNLNFSSYDKYVLRNLSSDIAYSQNLEFSSNGYLNSGISLFSSYLVNGDYIVYPGDYIESTESKGCPIKIESETLIHETFYTPIIDGVRKKIELKSKSSSPCLILSVRVVPTRTQGIDIAVLADDENIQNAKNVLKDTTYLCEYVEKTNDEDDLIALFKKQASICIVIEDRDDVMMTSHVNYLGVSKSQVIEEGSLKGLDSDLFIRELGGDIFLAGKGYSYPGNAYLTSLIEGNNNGSIVIKVGKNNIENILSYIDLVF